jgi:uncharacterized integral membrane protein
MKIFSGVFAFIILVPVLCFALSNRTDVAIGLWPFDGVLQMPLYLIGLAPLMFGLLVGGLWGWIGGVPHRLKARRLNKELGALNSKIDELKKTAIVQHAHAAPKRPFWERKL